MHIRQFPDSLAELAHSKERMRDAALLRATTELFVLDIAHDRDAVDRYGELALHFLPRVATEDRAFVSEQLATCDDAPHAVILLLARDVIDVASPLLRYSSVLGPIDLLSVIAATGAQHHRVIARRPSLSPEVRRALRLTIDTAVLAYLDDGATMREDGRAPEARRTILAAARYYPGSLTGPLDPWRLLGLDRRGRVAVIAELASRPPPGTERKSASPDLAFRSILAAARIVGFARGGQLPAIITAIAEGLDLPSDLTAAAVNDPGGELLAVMLKALRLDDVQARQVLLLANPAGRDVTAFFPLSDLFSGLEVPVAETLVAAWRKATVDGMLQHQQQFADTSSQRRQATDDARESVPRDEKARRA